MKKILFSLCFLFSISMLSAESIIVETPYLFHPQNETSILSSIPGALEIQSTFDAETYYRSIFYVESTEGGYFLRNANGQYVQKPTDDPTVALGALEKQAGDISVEEPASFVLEVTAENVLIKNTALSSYINSYYGSNGGLGYYTGTGDASQWEIIEVSTGTKVTSVKENTAYYLKACLQKKLGYYAYYNAGNLFLQENADDNSTFSFISNGNGGYYLHHIKTATEVVAGATSSNFTLAKTSALEQPTVITLAAVFNIVETDEGIKFEVINSNHALAVNEGKIIYSEKTFASLFTSEEYTNPVVQVDFPKADICYAIRSLAVSTLNMYEEGDGTLQSSKFNVSLPCFWEFVPTGKDHCYYIHNLTTGKYIQSTNKGLSESAIVGTNPVEFYIGKDTKEGTTTNGYYYMSSTDNEVYNQPSSTTYCLNRAGSGTNIVVWHANYGAKNSYWEFEPVEYAYEISPFMAEEELGEPVYAYKLITPKGDCLGYNAEKNLTLQAKNNTDAQSWYFVGTSNNKEGFIISNKAEKMSSVEESEGTLLLSLAETPKRWKVFEADAENDAMKDYYYFRPFDQADVAGTALKIGNDSLFTFKGVRSDLSRRLGIHFMPCGSLTGIYVSSLKVEGDNILKPLIYPLTYQNTVFSIDQEDATPSSWYTLFTKDRAIVPVGEEISCKIELNKAPADEEQVFIYFDWDDDGVFESMQELNNTQEIETLITVPADAKHTDCRARLRITNNGLSDAEDEVTGQILDFVLNVEDAAERCWVKLRANSDRRGDVVLSEEADDYARGTELTATATAKGSSEFVCWKEGNNVVSLKEAYSFNVNHNIDLEAIFSPINDVTAVKSLNVNSAMINIVTNKKAIRIITDAKIKQVCIFSVDGVLMLKTNKKDINVEDLNSGTYIVKVYTSSNDASKKVLVQ